MKMFSIDNISSAQPVKRKKGFLVLREGPTNDINYHYYTRV